MIVENRFNLPIYVPEDAVAILCADQEAAENWSYSMQARADDALAGSGGQPAGAWDWHTVPSFTSHGVWVHAGINAYQVKG